MYFYKYIYLQIHKSTHLTHSHSKTYHSSTPKTVPCSKQTETKVRESWLRYTGIYTTFFDFQCGFENINNYCDE